jgi:hypothetical protein
VPVKYLIMIYQNLAGWAELSDAQRLDFRRAHSVLHDELDASGELVAAEGLEDPSTAKIVSVRDGRTVASDGPFAEVKEHLAGFHLIECETMEQAIEWAAKVPDAAYGHVEVRPIRVRTW